MSYTISTPGKSPKEFYCDELLRTGAVLNMTTNPPLITSDVAGLTVDEETITTNEDSMTHNGITYLPGQVVLFQLHADADIEESDGHVFVDYQSEDGVIRDRGKVPVRIADWRAAS